MRHLILILSVVALLTGCGAYDTMTEGFKHSQEVANDIEKTVGDRPFVGFNWANGELRSVSVTFNGVPTKKTISEIITLARKSIINNFKQKPKQLVISFTVTGSDESGA